MSWFNPEGEADTAGYTSTPKEVPYYLARPVDVGNSTVIGKNETVIVTPPNNTTRMVPNASEAQTDAKGAHQRPTFYEVAADGFTPISEFSRAQSNYTEKAERQRNLDQEWGNGAVPDEDPGVIETTKKAINDLGGGAATLAGAAAEVPGAIRTGLSNLKFPSLSFPSIPDIGGAASSAASSVGASVQSAATTFGQYLMVTAVALVAVYGFSSSLPRALLSRK